MEKRNIEYAIEGDPFWNFEEEAKFIEVDTEKVFLLYLKENIGRLKTMFKQGNNNKEQVIDKVVDLINFSVLYYAWLTKEGQHGSVAEGSSGNHTDVGWLRDSVMVDRSEGSKGR